MNPPYLPSSVALALKMTPEDWGHCSEVVNVPGCLIIVNLNSSHTIISSFRLDTLWERYVNPFIPPQVMG